METLRNWLGVELDEASRTEKLVSGAGGLLALVLIYAACVLALRFHQPAGLGLLVPVGASAVLVNVLLLVLLAVAFNGLFRWRRYPSYLNHRDVAPSPDAGRDGDSPSHEEIMRALRELDSFVDISEDDLIRLVRILGRPASKQGHHHDAGAEG